MIVDIITTVSKFKPLTAVNILRKTGLEVMSGKNSPVHTLTCILKAGPPVHIMHDKTIVITILIRIIIAAMIMIILTTVTQLGKGAELSSASLHDAGPRPALAHSTPPATCYIGHYKGLEFRD